MKKLLFVLTCAVEETSCCSSLRMAEKKEERKREIKPGHEWRLTNKMRLNNVIIC